MSLWLAMFACAYVTRDEVDAALDGDGDGWAAEDDCDNENPDRFPGAPDVRGDGCDADCGREADTDGDDWPDAADCAPNDPNAFPCSPDEVDADGIDTDCDNRDEARPDACPSTDPDFPDVEVNPCSS